MHENHRERVRQRYLADGIESMPEHNVLEMLLFYCVPRKDTNDLAHRLISAFGSLSAVLDAPAERLMQVEGVGEATAVFLTLIPRVCARYLTQKQDSGKLNIQAPEELKAFACGIFAGSSSEEMRMFCFDGAGKLVNNILADGGTINNVALKKRDILDSAFRCNAESVIFIHNHPNGAASPSRDDVTATVELISLFTAVGIRVCDHFIIGSEGELLSMASTARYASLFD